MANTKRVYTYTPEQLERRAAARRQRYRTRPEVKEKAIAASKRWSEQNPDRVDLNHWRWREENREYINAQAREKHDPEGHRARGLENKYGLTLDAWERLFDGQGRACVCGAKTHGGINWHTDHDHATGKVRGILCRGCNLAIGMTRDDPGILRALADYVEGSRR